MYQTVYILKVGGYSMYQLADTFDRALPQMYQIIDTLYYAANTSTKASKSLYHRTDTLYHDTNTLKAHDHSTSFLQYSSTYCYRRGKIQRMRPDQRWFPTNVNERAAWFRSFAN